MATAGVAIVRGFAAPPSAQLLNKYCVPAEPLCGEVKLTAQEEPGVHARVCGAIYAPAAHPVPPEIEKARLVGEESMVTGTGGGGVT